MAWITKDSANAKIERRDEPYLTEAMKATIRDTYLPRYEKTEGALLPALHLLQHEHGWIPHQGLMELAEFLGIAPGDVIDCASFYEEFWLKRKGKHVVAVCRSIACEFCDASRVTDACREELGVEVGETTDDEQFTLVELECLGSCGTAPVALLDETLHEQLTPDRMREILAEVRAGRSPENQGREGVTPSA